MDNYMLRVLGSSNQTISISAHKMEPQKILYTHKLWYYTYVKRARPLSSFSSMSPEWATATRGRVQLVDNIIRVFQCSLRTHTDRTFRFCCGMWNFFPEFVLNFQLHPVFGTIVWFFPLLIVIPYFPYEACDLCLFTTSLFLTFATTR
jgi:hypothetical protein